MSDMVGNPEDQFSGFSAHIIHTVRDHLNVSVDASMITKILTSLQKLTSSDIPHTQVKQLMRYEPPLGKTNNVVSDQVRHKPVCTSTENS